MTKDLHIFSLKLNKYDKLDTWIVGSGSVTQLQVGRAYNF